MSLGNDLTPAVREETILNGGDITPATRLEWFLAKAAEGGGGGGGGTVYSPVLAQTTKSVSSHWVSSFSGGPILEDANYRVIVNGTTYEPLTGTAGEEGHICLGNTYVSDSDPSGDYGFGIFYKNNQLSAWLETGDSMTMQIDQIIQEVPVPTPTLADAGKVVAVNETGTEYELVESGGGSPWDAVIRLTHTNDSGADLPANLTPSIVSGSYSELTSKISNGGCPCILVEYWHPWGNGFAVPMAYIYYASDQEISMAIVGAGRFESWAVSHWGNLVWSSNDTIGWD